MNKLSLILATTTILAGCSTNGAPPPVAVAEVQPVAEVVPIAAAPKPQLGTYGFDTTGMDTTVLPGNNFYSYSNGTWAKNTPIPADKSNFGMFTMLDDLSKQRTRTIIEEAAKDPSNKVGLAYATFLDTAAIEAQGLAPIKPWLDEIDALPNNAAYASLAAKAGMVQIMTGMSA